MNSEIKFTGASSSSLSQMITKRVTSTQTMRSHIPLRSATSDSHILKTGLVLDKDLCLTQSPSEAMTLNCPD